MCARVYVLLNVEESKGNQVARVLRKMPGVIMVDTVENRADVVMVVEAPKRRRLAELTVRALTSVETSTEQVQLLPARASRSVPRAVMKSVPSAGAKSEAM